MFALVCIALLHSAAADSVEIGNGRIKLSVSSATGRFSVSWGNQAEISRAWGEAKLSDGAELRTDAFSSHKISRSPVRNAFGSGEQLVVTHSDGPTPTALRQTFSIYRGRAELLVRLDLVGSPLGTNQISPVVSEEPVKLKHTGPLQSLFVPYDNDNYFRYSSSAWDQKEGSFEVGSLCEDASRRGLVVGSIDHDIWKSAVKFERNGGIRAYAAGRA